MVNLRVIDKAETVAPDGKVEHNGRCHVWVPKPTGSSNEGKINFSAKAQHVGALLGNYTHARLVTEKIDDETRKLRYELSVRSKGNEADGWVKAGFRPEDQYGNQSVQVQGGHLQRFQPIKRAKVRFTRVGSILDIDISMIAPEFKARRRVKPATRRAKATLIAGMRDDLIKMRALLDHYIDILALPS